MKAAMKEISDRNLLVEKDAEDNEAEPSTDREESPPPPEKFVNTGLKRWEEIRNGWLSSASTGASSSSASNSPSASPAPLVPKPSSSSSSSSRKSKKLKRHAKDIDIDEVIDLIVSNRWRQQPPKNISSSTSSLDTAKSATRRRDDACFPSPVSLPQMVDVLVDLWEAEGLDI